MSDVSMAAASAAPASGFYRAVWRWHFYAGLFVLPFMISLALTGGAYLLKDEINDALYPELRLVAPAGTPPLSPSAIAARAADAVEGTVIGYAPPAAPERSAQVKIRAADASKQLVYVNPYDGAVLGRYQDVGSAGTPVMWTIRKIHSLEYFGWVANRLIELVGCWAIIMVVTGFYLWLPRGRSGGVFALRLRSGRAFWRDLHAVTGAYAGIVIAFLALSGLPWSGYWGGKFYDFANSAGLGMPTGYWSDYPLSTVPAGEMMDRTPWAMEREPLPASAAADAAAPTMPIGLDQAVATFEDLGIHKGYAVNFPAGETGVFTASVYPDDVSAQRIIHLDQYSGAVLFDMRFADLGALGRAAEWGISVHFGQEYGLANLVVMLLACIGIVVMSVAALVMWWKRRPAGSLGAPRAPRDLQAPRAFLVIAIAFGMIFPLVGLSLLVMLTIDMLLPIGARARLA